MKILSGIRRGARSSWSWLRRASPWWPGRWKKRALESANLFRLMLSQIVQDGDDHVVRFTGGHIKNAMEEYIREVGG